MVGFSALALLCWLRSAQGGHRGLFLPLMAVSLAAANQNPVPARVLALVFFLASLAFVYRSFYGMRIKQTAK